MLLVCNFLGFCRLTKWFCKTAVIKKQHTANVSLASRRVNGNEVVLFARHVPVAFQTHFVDILFCFFILQNNVLPRVILAFSKCLKAAKCTSFPYSSNGFWANRECEMLHFASFSFARLLPRCVFGAMFLPTFPPIRWHLMPPFTSATRPFSRIALLFDAFSKAKCKS